MDESSELEQLRELIELFPAKFSIDEVEEANRLALTRFDALDNEFLLLLANPTEGKNPIFTIENCFRICRFLHGFIFNKIKSIHGEFRNKHHRGSGTVYFGGQRHQEMRARYTGSPPDRIEKELTEAFENILSFDSSTPVDDALRFYQIWAIMYFNDEK